LYGDKVPATRAVLELRAEGVDFKPHFYRYVRSGTDVAARDLGVEEHMVVKTLVMEDENEDPFIILMHGDKLVSAKALARTIKAKTVRPVKPREAKRLTGYMVGGISPFWQEEEAPCLCRKDDSKPAKILRQRGQEGLHHGGNPSGLDQGPRSDPGRSGDVNFGAPLRQIFF